MQRAHGDHGRELSAISTSLYKELAAQETAETLGQVSYVQLPT